MSSNENIYVVASKAKIKTEKRTDDLREKITTLWTRFTSGHQSEYFFLEKVKNLDRNNFKNINHFLMLHKFLRLL